MNHDYTPTEVRVTTPRGLSVGILSPGCYVDGHRGQYAPRAAVEICDDLLGTTIGADWPAGADGQEYGAYGESGPWGGLMGDTICEDIAQRSDDAEAALNAATDGGYWEWVDGEFFLSAYCAACDECEEEHA